jgi:hypothetical protein
MSRAVILMSEPCSSRIIGTMPTPAKREMQSNLETLVMTSEELVECLESVDMAEELDDLVVDAAERQASAVNNCEVADQIEYLIESGLTPKEILAALWRKRG